MSSSTRSPDLRLFTGYLLRRAFVRVVGVIGGCVPPDAQVRDIAVMMILAERGAVSQRSLGALTHVNRTLIVKLVDRLEANGWVARDRNPDDRRSYALRLTAAGIEALPDLSAGLEAAEAELTKVLSPLEQARLNEHLRVLLDDDVALEVATLAARSGYLIEHAHRLLRGWAERSLGQLDLHPRDFGFLATLGRDAPCSQSRLAASLEITPPAVLTFVDQLEARGLVRRSRNVDDRRTNDITLTREGRRVLGLAQQVAVELQATVVDRLGVAGDTELRALLVKLLEAPPRERRHSNVGGPMEDRASGGVVPDA